MEKNVIYINQNHKDYKKYNDSTEVFRKFIKKETNKLAKHSEKVENKTKKFKENLKVLDRKTNSLIKLQHNPIQNQKDNYLWFVYNQKLLEEKMEKDGGYTTLFITLTLPSSFHKFTSIRIFNKITKKYDLVKIYNPKTKKHEQARIFNKNFNKENTTNEGYKLLNKSFRSIYKNFRIERKPEKIFFSKVIEPHKDLTCHLHAIIYVKTQYLANMKQHIKNTIKNNNLGRYDIEEIKDITRSTSYLLKYVAKTTNPKDEKGFHFLNGWKKKNKIRVFTHSNLDLERYIFKKVNSVLKLSKNLKDKNPITKVLENCDIAINTKDFKTKEIMPKKYSNKNARYKVIINRTRRIFNVEEKLVYLEKVKKNRDTTNQDFQKYFIWDDELCVEKEHELKEKIYNYKIDDFIIKDTKTNEILYNKNDFLLLTKNKFSKYIGLAKDLK